MTSVAGTWTLPGAIGVYQISEEVRCRGFHHGEPCGKVLAKRLAGSVSLKCSKCDHVETYLTKQVDNTD